MLTGIAAARRATRRIPQALRSDLYADAALAGASNVVIGNMFGIPYGASALSNGCFVLRASLHGNHTSLALAGRPYFRAAARRNDLSDDKRDSTSQAIELPVLRLQSEWLCFRASPSAMPISCSRHRHQRPTG
jgi:hypothetical protein